MLYPSVSPCTVSDLITTITISSDPSTHSSWFCFSSEILYFTIFFTNICERSFFMAIFLFIEISPVSLIYPAIIFPSLRHNERFLDVFLFAGFIKFVAFSVCFCGEAGQDHFKNRFVLFPFLIIFKFSVGYLILDHYHVNPWNSFVKNWANLESWTHISGRADKCYFFVALETEDWLAHLRQKKSLFSSFSMFSFDLNLF